MVILSLRILSIQPKKDSVEIWDPFYSLRISFVRKKLTSGSLVVRLIYTVSQMF